MAALQITVNGTAQNVARLVSLSAPMVTTSSIAPPNFTSNITNLVTLDNPVISATESLTNGFKFFENNIVRLVETPTPMSTVVHLQSGVASPRAPTGGGGGEPVSKESWE